MDVRGDSGVFGSGQGRTRGGVNAAAFAAVEQSAGSFVTWYSDVYYEGKLRPECDSGDHAHLNAAGTDVIVARAVPDVERLLMRLGVSRHSQVIDRPRLYSQVTWFF